MKVDLFSFVQGETKTISFMSQSLGLMAELDIGTDNWRWMGDTRFFLGFLRGRKDTSRFTFNASTHCYSKLLHSSLVRLNYR